MESNKYEKADVDFINCFEDEQDRIRRYKKRGVDFFTNTSKEEKVDNKIKFNKDDNIEVELNDMFIKPCPFCGAEAKLDHYFEPETNDDPSSISMSYSYIKCRGCGAKSKSINISFKYSSDQEVIKAWNKRAYEDD